jgi:hypothetical protein
VNPIVALALGWAVGDDLITWRTAVSALLVIGAVLLTREGPPGAIRHPLSAIRSTVRRRQTSASRGAERRSRVA